MVVPVYKESADVEAVDVEAVAAVFAELKTCPNKRDVASLHADHSSVRHFEHTAAAGFSRSWPYSEVRVSE